MSVAEISEQKPGRQTGIGQLALTWLPALVVIGAILGVVLVVPGVNGDENARDWYRNRLGGSDLYRLNFIFARLVPFLAGGFIALALLQRRLLPAKERHTAESLQRHGWTEVATHWLNGVGIILCLVTAVWLLKWIDNPVSLLTAYTIHFVGAGFSVAAVAHHVTYQLFGGQGLLPGSRRDVKNAVAETVSYSGVYRGLRGVFGVQLPLTVRRKIQPLLRRLDVAPDRAGKYLATEKVISYSGWGVLIGIVVITGVIKSLQYVYGLPGWLRQGSTFLHDGATLFIIIWLMIHVGALTLVPRHWALLKSMFTTRVSRRYAEEHLPLWAEDSAQTGFHNPET
jgi:cytochrome b subunit of formate dehydrogenase